MQCPKCNARMHYIANGLDADCKPVRLYKCSECGHREAK
jgi:DNA-directed RNA polymerase subunit M/transcription elongation factor TFIIS